MRHGTEVDIVKADPQSDGSVAIELVGTRRFQLVGDPWLGQADTCEPEEPVPAPLAQVAGATQGTSKFILSRVEFASDGDSAGWPETSEGLSKESQRLLEDLVDEVDNEANLQQSKGAQLCSTRSHFSCVSSIIHLMMLQANPSSLFSSY